MKANQEAKIVAFCREHIWITQRDAYKLGIYRLASRIFDMTEKGYVIIREYVRVKNADGSESQIARYSIAKYPEYLEVSNAENVSV